MGLHARKRVAALTDKRAWKKNATLCWDCALATEAGKCPWVGDGEPVDGWWARPKQIRMMVGKGDGTSATYLTDTYTVIMCPLFKRDGWRGGIFKHDCGSHVSLKDAEPSDLSALAAAIIMRQVEDWKTLQFGAVDSAVALGGNRVKRGDVIQFFNSKYFEELLSCVSTVNPQDAREVLRIPCQR